MRTAHNIGLSVRYDTPGDVSRRRSKRKKGTSRKEGSFTTQEATRVFPVGGFNAGIQKYLSQMSRLFAFS